MVAQNYTVFNTINDEGESKQYNFDIYSDGDLPISGGGVYIYSKNYNNKKDPEYYYIECIPKFSEIFERKDIVEKLKKHSSNSLLIYECEDIGEMNNILRWVKKSDKFINFYRGTL
jgi:hypothetical protein